MYKKIMDAVEEYYVKAVAYFYEGELGDEIGNKMTGWESVSGGKCDRCGEAASKRNRRTWEKLCRECFRDEKEYKRWELGEHGTCERCGGDGIYKGFNGEIICSKCYEIEKNKVNTKYDFGESAKRDVGESKIGALRLINRKIKEGKEGDIKGIISDMRGEASVIGFMKKFMEISVRELEMRGMEGNLKKMLAFMDELIRLYNERFQLREERIVPKYLTLNKKIK